ncbi:signal transduction histidine kinase [Candidatus Vecturithrix granuli]|uniref:histidine kinase n=1 Tax=Vecturithrix granuli TaxID=1499967 RepID=A0A0S6WAL3_VECG1|nr:signal transduction histidine kinase [Candidatus Vecturithrix granuli]
MARILVVDDNPNNLDVLAELFDQHDFVVLFALDGRTGLQRAESGRPDLILLDVMMANMDGFETCRKLKANSSTKDIPVIFMTALTDTTHKVKAFASGAVDYITKPFEPEEVLARVHTHLTLQQLRQDLQTKNEQLQDSLDTLHSTQEQLVQAKKMAALGRLVAGIAHEINTPVGVGITAASFLEKKSREVADLYASGKLPRSEFETYLRQSVDSTASILSNLQRAAKLIQHFKQVAIDQHSEEHHRVNLKLYFSNLFTGLQAKYEHFPYQTSLTCQEDLYVDIYPGMLVQILSQLFENSVLHGFEHAQTGTISLDIHPQGNRLFLQYRDNGKGMNPEQCERVFDPFFTTKRAQGAVGLGMHIVYNLITQTLGGTIECQSEPEQGTTFSISLPILNT